MKWKGREGSGNIEDRRGMSTGRMAVGGGIGTIVVLLIVLLLGGDPVKLLDSMQQAAQQKKLARSQPLRRKMKWHSLFQLF